MPMAKPNGTGSPPLTKSFTMKGKPTIRSKRPGSTAT